MNFLPSYFLLTLTICPLFSSKILKALMLLVMERVGLWFVVYKNIRILSGQTLGSYLYFVWIVLMPTRKCTYVLEILTTRSTYLLSYFLWHSNNLLSLNYSLAWIPILELKWVSYQKKLNYL